METLAPLNPLDEETLSQAAGRWQGLFGDAPRPHIALIAGGSSALHRIDPVTARTMGEEVRGFAGSLGGSVVAVTSPRTSAAAADALEHALGSNNVVHRWDAGAVENPYTGYLAVADILVVSGESESMLSEAAATGKKMLIYPVPEREPGLRARFAEAVLRRSQKPRINKRGTIRPQRGLQYYCARLVDRGWVRPRRDLSMLHHALVENGTAQMFGREFSSAGRPVLHEAEQVAARVRAVLGWADD
jgi:mitochondrial fission protein ELM1